LSGKTSKKMVGGAIYLIVKCKTEIAKQNVFKIINEICDAGKIKRDDAIKIIIDTNELNDTIFKIEVINEYSLTPHLINNIQIKLNDIDGVTIERKFDQRFWNINKKEFINVGVNAKLRNELFKKLELYKARKN